MASSSRRSATAAPEGGWRLRAEVALAALATCALARLLGLGGTALLLASVAAVLAAGVLALAAARAGLAAGGFGWPNRITLMRAFLAALLLGLVLVPERRAAITVLAVLAVASDALDGWLARRFDGASAFGARFDMETDAALGLVLCLLLLATGVCGPWILAAGLARYAFVATLALLPWLDRPLPESARRRAAAGFAMAALAAALVPALPPALALACAAAASAVTLVSFALDLAWLRRRAAAS